MRNSITRVVTAANSLEALTIMELCESSDTARSPQSRYLTSSSCSIEEIRMVSFHDEAELIPSLVNIIRNSGPGPSPLKILRFRTQGVQAGQLSVLLQLTPALETLDMPIPPAEDLALLVQGGIIPRLEKCEFFVNDFTHSAADDVTTKALELLAASRCEMSSDPASLSAECSRIKKFCLHFDRPRLIQAQLALLEGWERTSGKELVHFKNQIFSEIPELECRRPRRARKFDRRWIDRVLVLLESIENYKVNRVGDVYTSELHLVLKMLTERQLLGDDKCLFRQRANTILKKWEPLFEQSLSSRHWVMKGEYSLVYISENDAVRTGPDALTNIVYGIEDDTRLHYPAFLDF
ncbi:hypothetical protein NLJ89_g4398 [Agrocybe chaxingu]|uniref:Uncharacterized protein n=1 Tax=Agrocybe chaxingu TaxID=84603 RepID=A0A9W8K272_9AGAR|nr:hypothetical protein NLJ89_g4398 [Agrocybe chaxingu]